MTGDDTGLRVSRDGEQPPDAGPGLPQDSMAELDAYGMPVQGRLARRRAGPEPIAALVLGIVSLVAAIREYLSHHMRAGNTVALAAGIAGWLAWVLYFGWLWRHRGLDWPPGRVSHIIAIVGLILGLAAVFLAARIYCPTCQGDLPA